MLKQPNSGYYTPCSTTDPELFFPVKNGSAGIAKKLCLGCEAENVRDCLTSSLADTEKKGIWAATNNLDRDTIRDKVHPDKIGAFITLYVDEMPPNTREFVDGFAQTQSQAPAQG